MKLLIATAMFTAVTSGTALAQPAAAIEPAAPASTEPPPTPTEPPLTPNDPPFATPALTKPLRRAPAPIEPPLATPALTMPLPPARARTALEWYGWQVLLADGATIGFAFAIHNGAAALGWIGSGAMVHASHGRYGRSLASLSMRVVLPLLGVMAGSSSARGCTGDYCGLGEVVVGGLVGVGAAELIDLVMATDEHALAPPTLSRSWAPVASVRHAGATFGIAARF